MLRDVFAIIQQETLANMPAPGLSAVFPSAGATGTVGLSGAAYGTFYGLLEILTTGQLGVATAKLSLDAADGFTPSFQQTFTLPEDGSYPIPLEQFGTTPWALPSGLVLTFPPGTFTDGDEYIFTASAVIDFRVGEEELSSTDRIFPSVVFSPQTENFVGTEDFGGTKTILNAPRALAMGENLIAASCWGIDYERTELLKNQLIYGIRAGVQSPSRILGGEWNTSDASKNRAGREYTLRFAVKIPVVELDARATKPIQPPQGGFDLTITPTFPT